MYGWTRIPYTLDLRMVDPGDDQRSEHLADTPLPASPGRFESWQGVQIYRLNRPVVHCFVHWGTYNGILLQIAQFLQVHLRSLTGVHHLQAPLVGLHEAEEAIVLQYVNDRLPRNSLQDIGHGSPFQAVSNAPPRAPEVSRRVHRVVPHLNRCQVLRKARVANYCFLQADRCLVFFNNVLWPEQDQTARRIAHGCYLKIVATPPLDERVSTKGCVQFRCLG